MPNINSPFGVRMLGRQNDATPSFSLGPNPRKIAANNTTKIAKGDILLNLATGYVTAAVAALSTTGRDQAVGIFWGCQYLSISQGKRIVSPFWPGGDASGDVDVQYIPLIGHPGMRCVIQGNAGPFTFADIGLNYDIAYAAPTIYGSWGKSNVVIANSTGAVTATLPFRLVALWSQVQRNNGQPGTDDTTAFNWGVFEFNMPGQTGL